MPSFPKLLARPRLQLLVLMLVLGTGILPKPAAASWDNSEKGPWGKFALCFSQDCASDQRGRGKVEECLREPKAFHAPAGCKANELCYVFTKYSIENGKKTAGAIKHCAKAWEIKCLENEPGNCLKLDLTKEEDVAKFNANQECENAEKAKEDPPSPDDEKDDKKLANKTLAKIEAKPGNFGTATLCTCKGNECNSNKENTDPPRSSGPAGVKQLGYSVALVGALLVSVFPLRNLVLVG